ncbi:class I SAM-dependent methyltransferase [Clostridium gasigenes]|uniref:tRNA (mnm(5)s(2)U34)-methyltransferase n=1 Tax=Clostridium gasigenes TaxID=94869 RepID=UPI001626F798|nr:class I SAM-dependent methyltransferase [Clostridium gasigenes]MBB6623893.1 class I SAM-dependent methyltransferase [Clostridium gasigenes]
MFRYVADISNLSHFIIKNFLENRVVAIDGTLGNGFDTDFLSDNFEKVYSFEIQKDACNKYKNKNNVKVINDSHHLFKDYVKEDVDCIMYNLGFLPGGDKGITTMHITSLQSIKIGLEMLKSGGIMTICIYKGHIEGQIEGTCILSYLSKLPKSKYGVMSHNYLNRAEAAPLLVVIEKK